MKNKKKIFICITGIDGSGKTTQAKKLVKNLSLNGIKSKYVYARGLSIILKPFLIVGNLLFLHGTAINKDYESYSDTKKEILKKHNFLSKIFYKILFLDYYLQLLYKVKIPLLLNKNIVCDRYIYDTVITNFAVDTECSDDEIFSLIERGLSFLPTPDIIFLIDISEEVAYKRKNDIPAIGYLINIRKYYLSIANRYNMIKINGTGRMEDIEREIFDKTLLILEGWK